MSQDWTEKYRPKTLSDVLGNPSAVSALRSWAEAWDKGRPNPKVAILMGSPGIGKTTSAEALANDMGWGLVEMNASDQRTADAIGSVALRGAYSNTFTESGTYLNTADGGRKLIVLDEADSLFGNVDRGAVPAITKLIRETLQPVLLIVNDFYALSRKSSAFKSETLQIEYRKPTSAAIVKMLRKIAVSEGFSITDEALNGIVENARGDMRAAVRDLESMALGKDELTAEDTSNLSGRNERKSMFDLMSAIFRKSDAMGSRKLMFDTDEDPAFVMRWIDINLPYEYTDKGDLVRGYEKLSRADIFLGRVWRRQYYGLWSYAGDMMTAGVCVARMTKKFSMDRIRYPTARSVRAKAIKEIKSGVCQKLADHIHTTTKRVEHDVLPSLKLILVNDMELRVSLTVDLDLQPEEIAFLLNVKPDSKAVKNILEEAGAIKEARRLKDHSKTIEPVKMVDFEVPAPAVKDKPEPEKEAETKKAARPKGQRSLFDF